MYIYDYHLRYLLIMTSYYVVSTNTVPRKIEYKTYENKVRIKSGYCAKVTHKTLIQDLPVRSFKNQSRKNFKNQIY